MSIIEKVFDEILNKNKKIKEPAKRWRNKWKAKLDHRNTRLEIIKKGTLIHANYIWPTKDIAETKAQWWLSQSPIHESTCEYLGAYPEE